MSATQNSEAEPADHTVKGLLQEIQGPSLRSKPADTNEAAQTQTGSSRAPVPAGVVDPARPQSPSASVALLADPFPHEGARMVSLGHRQIEGKKGVASPLIIPDSPSSASRTDDDDDPALFGRHSRADTSMTMSTNTTGTSAFLERSCTWYSTSSSESVETSVTSPSGDCDMTDELTRHLVPLSPNNYSPINPQSYNTGNPATSELGSVVANAKASVKSSISRAHDVSGPYPKSVRWVEPKPLATRKTMPSSLGLRETFTGDPKPLISHRTFPVTPQELACAAGVSSPRLRGPSPVLEKGISGILGPKDLPIRTLLTQSSMMKAGLSDEAQPEVRVVQYVQDQGYQNQILHDTTESAMAVDGGGTLSKHTFSPSATQPRTPERPKTSQGVSMSTPERDDSPTDQLTPNTSDSGSDQGADGGVMCEELGENSQDKFVQKIYDVILQHTPGAVLDELDQPLKELANRCVERAANLAQASLNKRASAIFSGDSPPYSTESSPCDASPSSHPAGAGGGGASFGQDREQANHRKRRKDSCDGSPDKDSPSQGDGSGKDGKKVKMTETSSKIKLLSCPYRTRNPLRFNVRDHESCATQGHVDMARLKRHIKNFHGPKKEKNKCGRCRLEFDTVDELKKHQTQDNGWSCSIVREDVANTDLEDGITKEIEERINGRKKDTKVDTWEGLWVLLFPGDAVPRRDFVPAVELFEVWHEFRLDNGGFPPLESREDYQQYVNSKFKRCIEDPTKERKDRGVTLRSITEAVGAPAGTTPPGHPVWQQQARPDLTPSTPSSSNKSSSPLAANRERNGRDRGQRPREFSHVMGHSGVGSSGPLSSQQAATPNLAAQSLSSYPRLAPRLAVTAKAKEAAASSTVQPIPSPPGVVATSNPSHDNGMGHSIANGGLNFVKNGIASAGFSQDGNNMNNWLRGSDTPFGMGKIPSPVAASKQPERMFTRRQSSSAATAIYDPNTALPREQEQQQVGSFAPSMNPGDYGAETSLLVSHTSGGVPDGSYNNAAIGTASQVPAATAAPTAMASMIGGGFAPFDMTTSFDEPYVPMGSTAPSANPTASYMCAGPAVACEGDVDLIDMSTSDQNGTYPRAQFQGDDEMEGLFPLWDGTHPGPHNGNGFQSI